MEDGTRKKLLGPIIPGKFYRFQMNKPIKREVLSTEETQWVSYLYVNKVEKKKEGEEEWREREKKRYIGIERGRGKEEAAISLQWSWCNLREDWR